MCQQCIDSVASNRVRPKVGGGGVRRLLLTFVSAARVGERRVRQASAWVDCGAEKQCEASVQAALLSTGGCGVTTAARDHKRGSTLRAQRGRRTARRARAVLCVDVLLVRDCRWRDRQRRGAARETGSCVAARSIAVESGRRVCWTGRASEAVSTIGAKWRCRAVGLQRVAGSAKAVSWRHGALEEDNASLALARCVWLVEWQMVSAAT